MADAYKRLQPVKHKQNNENKHDDRSQFKQNIKLNHQTWIHFPEVTSC